MELRSVDPRNLIENPDNPRRKSPPDQADLQMEASARAIGILQPPVVREVPKGLMTIYGHRRVRGAVAAGLADLRVLVLGADEDADDDAMRALIENIIRKSMSPVEQWRAIERLVSDRWTEEAISTALVLPIRTIRKLRLLSRFPAPMLDRMHAGDMPNERELRLIAFASPEAQASAWKANKPKRGEQVYWSRIASVLSKQRLYAKEARFGADEEAAFGLVWEEDLFAPAGEDSRSTAQVDAFMAAQQAWLEANLPENGTLIEVDEYHRPALPKGAQQIYGKPGKDNLIGHYLDPRTGEVRTAAYEMPEKRRSAPGAKDDGFGDDVPRAPRAPVTAKGVAMIGDLRTDALHQALREKPIGDDQLIGMLVLALGGRNVDVKTGVAGWTAKAIGSRARIAETLTEGGALTRDLDVLRHAARETLVLALSCRENHSASGMGARHAGTAIDADAYLPTMATTDFLSCLSKGAMEGVAVELGVPLQPTGKATRGAVIERCKRETYLYPAARFAPSETELTARRNPATVMPDASIGEDDEAGTESETPDEPGPENGPAEGPERAGDEGIAEAA